MTCDHNDDRYGAVCRFACDEGTELVGTASSECTTDYRNSTHWTSSPPTCEVVTCKSLDPPSNGTKTGCSDSTEEVYGTVCSFRCNEGYSPKAVLHRRCQQDATWSGTDLHCEIDTCSPLTDPQHGHVSPMTCTTSSSVFNDECDYVCDEGYSIDETARSVKCLNGGRWSVNGPAKCTALTSPINGIKSGCDNPIEAYNTSCSFRCNEGYSPKGVQQRICQQDGTWSGDTLHCSNATGPEFTSCPTSQILDAGSGKISAIATWTLPTATDNSGTAPAVVRVEGQPSDVDKPVFHNCPGDIRATADAGAAIAHVTWTTPTATDSTDRSPGCSTIRISGSTTVQTDRMTSYTMTGQTQDGRPVYACDSTDDFLYFYQNSSQWVVGPTIGSNIGAGISIGKRSLDQSSSRVQHRYPFSATNNDPIQNGHSDVAALPSGTGHYDGQTSTLPSEDPQNDVTARANPIAVGAGKPIVGLHSIHRRDIDITCLDGMVWHDKTKTCVHQCKRLPPPAFGHFTGTCDNTQGSSCTMECLPGYELNGSPTRTCVVRDNGTISYWDGTETRCNG
ncbi:SELP [Branchiostoma lanceolatum]|uniref:SELP protein n=1 Tax=Branchiostoma lanceolatum TaxID=7740 RepID=A0A8K0A790_BRALA|nr:SELP [Branchiostoma lanceolatum]